MKEPFASSLNQEADWWGHMVRGRRARRSHATARCGEGEANRGGGSRGEGRYERAPDAEAVREEEEDSISEDETLLVYKYLPRFLLR